MKKNYLYIVLSILLAFLVGKNVYSGTSEPEYVGSATCADCHSDKYDKLVFTPHFGALLSSDGVKVESCEACHGPGSLHVEAPDEENTIRNFKGFSSLEVTNVCLSCHQSSRYMKNFQREKHYQSGETCLSCHSVHPDRPSPMLLSNSPQELCFTCHQDKLAEFNLPYKHKVLEGRMYCWDCHDSHDTETSVQKIGFKEIDERCFKCHPSQRGPFTYEHLASNVGTCRVCHTPHGSENARLLRRSDQSLLCPECHSGGVEAESLFGPKTPYFHITSKTTYQNCTICHVKIHGSYLDRHFLR